MEALPDWGTNFEHFHLASPAKAHLKIDTLYKTDCLKNILRIIISVILASSKMF